MKHDIEKILEEFALDYDWRDVALAIAIVATCLAMMVYL